MRDGRLYGRIACPFGGVRMPRTEVVHEFYGRKTPVMVEKKRRLVVSELVKSRKLVTVS